MKFVCQLAEGRLEALCLIIILGQSGRGLVSSLANDWLMAIKYKGFNIDVGLVIIHTFLVRAGACASGYL